MTNENQPELHCFVASFVLGFVLITAFVTPSPHARVPTIDILHYGDVVLLGLT